MKTTYLFFILLIATHLNLAGQSRGIRIQPARFRTTGKTTIHGEVGFLTVPENRLVRDSRNITIKFVRLKSLSRTPREPVIYLEGGGRSCTWQAESPKDLTDWLPILRVSDLILVDQRGTSDESLVYLWKDLYPGDFLVSSQAASLHYQRLCTKALAHLARQKIDISGYTVAEHARDIDQLTTALTIDKYSIFGFSYGTHIGMAVLKLFPDRIANAIFAGADGLDQSFNYPADLDNHFQKIAKMAAGDTSLSPRITDLDGLLKKVMGKLTDNPVTVTVKHPLGGKPMPVRVGPFGLALILRLETDDTNDIPAIPRLLYTIDRGEYSMLEWFVQKRVSFAVALPGQGINQSIASGVSDQRLRLIEKQAGESLFGNVVNFPFYDARTVWPQTKAGINTDTPLSTSVRTLFITGSLDCRTPVEQVNQLAQGFADAIHLIVENAGHEQAMWDSEIFDQAIPQFLSGQDVSQVKAFYKEIKFIPLTGPHRGHPSIR
jgi:pimeloyl-ACP methyl ester carboxylesterase